MKKKLMNLWNKLYAGFLLWRAERLLKNFEMYSDMDVFLSAKPAPHSASMVALAGLVRYRSLELEKKLDRILDKIGSLQERVEES